MYLLLAVTEGAQCMRTMRALCLHHKALRIAISLGKYSVSGFGDQSPAESPGWIIAEDSMLLQRTTQIFLAVLANVWVGGVSTVGSP